MAAVLKEEDFVEARIARIESDVAHIQTDISDLKSDVRELKKEMGKTNDTIGALRADMGRQFGEANEKYIELWGEIKLLRQEMKTMFATLDAKIDKVAAETRLWVLGMVLTVLLQFLSHAFHWLGF